ncbi:UNVERIFIED_CONTAM: hypothetical protein Slati_2769800 [Sesamum latifolium]|uniref:Retrotransposon gag domain-containing protein n=1 Tax=Sesamum latifolium TaxID=2727402 RepID=A0AAW2W2J9_9LAMI
MEIMGVMRRPMMEYSFPTDDGTSSSIAKPAVEANNFEIKPAIIQIIRSSVQFSGFPDEDPNKHLINFLEICDTFRFNGVSNDAVRLRIFPFSLCDTAKDWLQSLRADRESLYDAWERFKSMLRKCPHHELLVWRQVQTFYNGITLANRATIDAAAGGTIMKKLPSEVFNIIDKIATNLYSYGQERADKRTADIHSIDAVSALSAQMTTLTHKVDNLGAAMWNGATNRTLWCMRSDGALEPRLHPISNQDARLQSQEALIRNIEVQIGQLMSIVSGRKEGQLPSDTEKNPREQVNAIFVRNEKAIGDEPPKEKVEEAQAQKEEESQEETKGSPLILNLDMPSSAKFLKEVLSTKKKWEGGASVNLMPYSIFEKLGMHELTPFIITLQLADRSIKYPRGIVKDVLVNIGKFIIPIDFIVLDMEEDKNMPLILGRHFLAMSRALIDVQKGQLTFRVNDEHVVFNVFKPMKYLYKKEHDIFAMDNINTFGTNNVHSVKCEDPKEDCIENSNEDNLQDMKEEHEEVPNFVDTEQEVKSKLQTELLLNGSTSNPKVLPPFKTSDRKKASEDKWCQPNIMKRWRNQVDESVGFYKEHTKAWNDSQMRKKKFKDGDKRHHKIKGPIKVDWQRLKHYIKGTPPQLPQITSISTN